MTLNEMTVESIYEEIYNIAENSKSDEARLQALSMLLAYKREKENRAERQEAMAKLISSMSSL